MNWIEEFSELPSELSKSTRMFAGAFIIGAVVKRNCFFGPYFPNNIFLLKGPTRSRKSTLIEEIRSYIMPFVNVMPEAFTEEVFHETIEAESHIVILQHKLHLSESLCHTLASLYDCHQTWTTATKSKKITAESPSLNMIAPIGKLTPTLLGRAVIVPVTFGKDRYLSQLVPEEKKRRLMIQLCKLRQLRGSFAADPKAINILTDIKKLKDSRKAIKVFKMTMLLALSTNSLYILPEMATMALEMIEQTGNNR